MSAVTETFIFRDGRLTSHCSGDEWDEWRIEHPDATLLTSRVLGKTVRTYFTGYSFYECGLGYTTCPFETFVPEDKSIPWAGSHDAAGAVWNHRRVLSRVKRRWLTTSLNESRSADEGTVVTAPGPLVTELSISGELLPTIPFRRHMSRFLRLLREQPMDWYAAHAGLAVPFEVCAEVLVDAWRRGWIKRTERAVDGRPEFSLTPVGEAEAMREAARVLPSNDVACDTWAPWRPWMACPCPVCGLELEGTRRSVFCASEAEPLHDEDRHYVATLDPDTALVLEEWCRKGELEVYVSHPEARHERRLDGRLVEARSGIPDRSTIKKYVRMACFL